MVTKFCRDSKFSDFLGIKSEISQCAGYRKSVVFRGSISLQSFAYDTDELELIWDAASINEAKKKNRDALFMDISLVNNMPKFKIIDHGYNYSKSQFMLQEEGFTLPQGNLKFCLIHI